MASIAIGAAVGGALGFTSGTVTAIAKGEEFKDVLKSGGIGLGAGLAGGAIGGAVLGPGTGAGTGTGAVSGSSGSSGGAGGGAGGGTGGGAGGGAGGFTPIQAPDISTGIVAGSAEASIMAPGNTLASAAQAAVPISAGNAAVPSLLSQAAPYVLGATALTAAPVLVNTLTAPNVGGIAPPSRDDSGSRDRARQLKAAAAGLAGTIQTRGAGSSSSSLGTGGGSGSGGTVTGGGGSGSRTTLG